MRTLRKLLSGVTLALLAIPFCALAVLSMGGYAGGVHWLWDLTNHFKVFYAAAGLFLVCAFGVLKRFHWALAALLLTLLNLSQLVPLYLPTFEPEASKETFRLLQANVCAPIRDYSRLTETIKREKPKIVTLEECAERCMLFLKRDGLLRAYPYQARDAEHRLTLLSQFPLTRKPVNLHAQPAVLFATLKIGQNPVNLLMMHSTRPSSGAPYHRNQIIQFEQIARLLKESPYPVVMAGDLNTTPWGYSFQKLLRESGLKNTMNGFGFQPSFPAFIPKVDWWSTPMLPIDHVLTSPHWMTANRRVGPNTGSDHLPVIVDLQLK